MPFCVKRYKGGKAANFDAVWETTTVIFQRKNGSIDLYHDETDGNGVY